MLAYRYIALHYTKYFSIILFALVCFVVGFDYMENARELPDSANLLLLYFMYKAFYAVDMFLPLTLIFAMIATKVSLIRTNALVAFYSLGYSKTDVLKPFVVVSLLFITLFVAMHATSFARADEYATNLRKSDQHIQPTTNLFFTFENQYVFFGRLMPLQERAEDIRIFRMKAGKLDKVISAKSAYYQEGYWYVDHARMITHPGTLEIGGEGIEVVADTSVRLLKGFRPKILDQVHEGKVNFNIIDAIDALLLFTDQNVSVDRIKSALYKIFVYPLFVPSMIIIIFFFVPISSRFLNVTLFSFGAILATLLIWGTLYMLITLSNNKTVSSEAGIVLPIVLLLGTALFQWHRNRVRPSRTKEV